MVVGHNFTCLRRKINHIAAFSTEFKGWGLEDSFFGAEMIAKGNFVIPVLSSGVYHINHPPRSGSNEVKQKELHRNFKKYNSLLKGYYSSEMCIRDRDNDKTSSLEAQDSYERSFFEHVCTTLGIDSKLDEIMQERIKEIRYALFPGTVEILQALKDTGSFLGIITNGRPSRRRILDQLNISHFFENDALYISDECGMTKSDPQLFSKVAHDHPESELFLCDDEPAIIKIAQSCGWKTMYINHTQEGYLPIQKYLDEY